VTFLILLPLVIVLTFVLLMVVAAVRVGARGRRDGQ
jgi:hypothetical protein